MTRRRSTGRRSASAAQGLGDALRRREDALGQEQDRDDRGRGLGLDGRRRTSKVGGDDHEAEGDRARDRLGRAADSRRRVLRPVVDTWGAWSLPAQPKTLAVVGAGASGSEIASAYAPLRHRGDLIEMLDQILPARGQGLRQGRRARLQEAGHHDLTPAPRSRGRRGREVGEGEGRRRRARGRLPRASPAAAPPTPRRSTSARRRSRPRTAARSRSTSIQRTSNPKVYAIGDLVRGPGARPQGLRGGRRRGRDDRRRRDPPGRHRPRPRRHLLPPAGRERRHDRGRRPRRPASDVKVGKFKLGGVGAAAVYDDRDGMVKIVADAEVRRDRRRPHRRQPRLRHDQRAGRRDGARGRLPGAGPHRPPPPDDLRGRAGRRPRRRRLGDAR